MKHKIFVIGILGLAISCCPAATAQMTQKLTAGKHNEYGLIYSLPVTHFNIEVKAEKTVKKAGPYYNYAKKYLGTDDVVTKDSQTWTVKEVNVTSFGVPDKDNQYLMQFKSGSSPFLMLTEAGLPLAINTENVQVPAKPMTATAAMPTVLDDNAFSKAMSGEMLVSESLGKRAEIAANQIYKIRESRTNFATGEADQMPPDGEAMKLAMKQLDEQEAALTALFLGTTQTSTAVASYQYLPTQDVQDEVVFRVSDFDGLVSRDDLSGEPAYLTLKITAKGQLPVDEKGVEKKIPKGAVMYKSPGQAEVSLKYKGRRLFNKTFDVAQFGMDFGLNPEMFTDKKQPSYVKFYPATGGIQELGNVPPTKND